MISVRSIVGAMTVVCLWSSFPTTLLGSESIRAVRIPEGPVIDGRLFDKAWESTAPFKNFRMAEPEANGEPTEKTELRVVYDERNIYIGVLCFDRTPSKIAVNSMVHDGGDEHDRSDDLIRILLDPFRDKRNAYVFFVNPRGARSEGLAFGEDYSLNWDGVWEAKASFREDGWSVEVRIPFKTISFKPGLRAWGINVERYIARKQETIRMSGTNRDSFFFNPVEASLLTGIENIKQGLGLTFKPYGVFGGYGAAGPKAGTAWSLDGGFDIYKNFTPNFVGVLSANMDFAESEVDDRRINLTRFPLQFPEKRMFFLEGSAIFDFASTDSFIPFFSRRIGLHEGEQIPIVFGAKLYGKIGNTNMAVLDAKTDRFGNSPGRNFLAARMSQNVLAESRVGWIFTHGSPEGERNSLAGVDFTYQTSRLWEDKNFSASAWCAYNWNAVKDGRHHGFGFKIDYPNDLWDVMTSYAYYGDSMDPGLGFMPRNGIQTYFGRISFQPRPRKGFLDRLVRQFDFGISGDFYWDLSGRLETRRISIQPLSFQAESGEYFEFSIIPTRDVLPYDFEVFKGVLIPAGRYDFTSCQIELYSADHRPVVMETSYTFGGFYSGRYQSAEIGLTLKFKGYVTLSLSTDHVRARLLQGRFDENIFRLKADFFLSPDLGLMNYFQYDDISRELGLSMRLRWRISPGNEIFVVFNKNWEKRGDPISRFVPLESRGTVKVSLSIRP